VYFYVLLALSVATRISSLTYNKDTYFVNRAILVEPDTYRVFWNFSDSDIVFKVVVRTSGWIGFGLSPNGGMFNSDLVLAWLDKKGQIKFQDSHVDETTEVKRDVTQNWKLLFYLNENRVTTLIFRRDLKVCGQNFYEDINIDIGMCNFVIFAWGNDADVNPKYHKTRRGAKSLPLTATLNQEIKLDMDGVELLEFDVKVKSCCIQIFN